VLEITLKYAPDRTRTIAGIKRISKPGLRIYARADRIPRVLGGIGVAVVSTSHGLMTTARHASAISAARCSVMSGDLRAPARRSGVVPARGEN